MVSWIIINFVVFLVVMMIAGLIIPQILLIAFRKNLFDSQDSRKIHHGTIPRLGGIAFFPAILFSIMLMFGIGRMYAPGYVVEIIPTTVTGFFFIICAVIILYLVGIADDLVGVKYRAKFIAQILASMLVVAGGIYMDNLHGFLGLHQLPLAIAVLFTILLMVFITNAINLIDGIDGLASGLSAIACAFYGCVFFLKGYYMFSMIAFATLGALVPFFYYNVFGNVRKHSKIFMGDTGALTIGMILSALSIRITRIDDVEGSYNMAVVAFAPLIIPCFDVVRVYIHRLKAHHNPFLPDKIHIHHKLLALGLKSRYAMPAIVVVSFLVGIINYWLSIYLNITALFAFDLAMWLLTNMALSRLIRRREISMGKKLYW